MFISESGSVNHRAIWNKLFCLGWGERLFFTTTLRSKLIPWSYSIKFSHLPWTPRICHSGYGDLGSERTRFKVAGLGQLVEKLLGVWGTGWRRSLWALVGGKKGLSWSSHKHRGGQSWVPAFHTSGPLMMPLPFFLFSSPLMMVITRFSLCEIWEEG